MFGQQKGTAKAGVNLEKQADKRRDNAVTLRQKKKEEFLNEKRSKVGQAGPATAGWEAKGMDAVVQETAAFDAKRLQEWARNLHMGTQEQQLEATTGIRKLLSVEDSPPIDNVIAADCVPKLVELLRCDSHPLLQFEASWALTNIASGTSLHTLQVIHSGAVPELVRLLSSPNEDVREQSVWALGNIAGDQAKYRDLVLSNGALDPLLKIIHTEPSLRTLRNATWCLSNLFRGKPNPELSKIQPALPTLAKLIHHNDPEVMADACWAVSYASDGPDQRIEAVLSLNIVPRLVEFLDWPEFSIRTPALRSVGNIVTGSDKQTQTMIDAGILPRLKTLLNPQNRKNIKKECCWALSNIAAGTQEQIQGVIDCGLIPHLVESLKTGEYEVKKEALWAFSNLSSGGTPEQVYVAVKEGCLGPMVDLLLITDWKILTVVLEAIENILASGQKVVEMHGGQNEYKNELLMNGGVEKIEPLQMHQVPDIFQKASSIIKNYFDSEEVDVNCDEAMDQPIKF